MCFGLGILSSLMGTGKAAKAQRKAAEAEAANDRLMAQAAQQQREASIAQQKASSDAATLLDRPVEPVTVQVGEQANAPVDPTTGRRRTPRSQFQISNPGSGLRI